MLVKELLQMKNTTEKQVQEFLEKYCIGTVLTLPENDKLGETSLWMNLPKGKNFKENKWERYNAIGTKPKKITWNKKQITKQEELN